MESKESCIEIATVKQGKQKLHEQAKQIKEFVYSFPSAGRCLAVSWKARLHHVEQLLGKTNARAVNDSPPSSSFP